MTAPADRDLQSDATVVEEQLKLIERGLRAIQLYLPNNPVYNQAIENIRRGFQRMWKELDELALRVKKTGFEWEGLDVGAGRDQSESLAWTLYKDGVRVLTMRHGVEEEEIVTFLTVVNKVRSLTPDAEDDLLTLLWEEEFTHIQYVFVELGQDDVPALEASSNFGATAPEQVRQELESDIAEAEAEAAEDRLGGVASVDDFDSTLYFLDESEIKHFKEELEREYEQDLRGNVMAMLFDILEQHSYADAKREVVQILVNLLPHILGAGDFKTISYILSESRSLLDRIEGLDPALRDTLSNLPNNLSTPETLTQILQTLDDAHVHPKEEELGELFKAFRPEAMETVLAWLPQLRSDMVRDLLERAVDPLAQYHPEAVARALASSQREVVLGALRLVARHNLHTVSASLGQLVPNKDPEIRTLLVHALGSIATPTALQHLRKMTDDREREVRMAAVKVLADKHHEPAFTQIELAVKRRLTKDADLSEKRVYYEAYGRLGKEKSIEFLGSVLVGKGFLKRRGDSETRACAATALGKVGTPAAREILESVAKDKDPLVRNAVFKALREIRA